MGKNERVEADDIEPRGMPEITPEMVQTTLKVLEAEGMVEYTPGGAYIPTDKGWQLLTKREQVKDVITAYGHPNVTCTHTTTFEITKASEIEKDADCIIAVKSDKGCKDLNEKMKSALKNGRKIEIIIKVGGEKDVITAYGSPALKLIHTEDMVVRKSDFIDDRTLAILADKSASELSKVLIEKLKNPNTEVKINLETK